MPGLVLCSGGAGLLRCEDGVGLVKGCEEQGTVICGECIGYGPASWLLTFSGIARQCSYERYLMTDPNRALLVPNLVNPGCVWRKTSGWTVPWTERDWHSGTHCPDGASYTDYVRPGDLAVQYTRRRVDGVYHTILTVYLRVGEFAPTYNVFRGEVDLGPEPSSTCYVSRTMVSNLDASHEGLGYGGQVTLEPIW